MSLGEGRGTPWPSQAKPWGGPAGGRAGVAREESWARGGSREAQRKAGRGAWAHPPLHLGALQLDVHTLLIVANVGKLLLNFQQAIIHFHQQKRVLEGLRVLRLLGGFDLEAHTPGWGGGRGGEALP